MVWPSIRASRPLTSAGPIFMPGEPMIADKSMFPA